MAFNEYGAPSPSPALPLGQLGTGFREGDVMQLREAEVPFGGMHCSDRATHAMTPVEKRRGRFLWGYM